MAPPLPPEIVHLIVHDTVLQHSDFHNLSLVAYVWKEPSQRRLFSSVTLDPGKQHDLYTSTHLVRYIKHLTLLSPAKQHAWTPFSDGHEPITEAEPDKDSGQEEAFHSEFNEITPGSTLIHMVPDPDASAPPHPTFPAFLRQIPKLESLTVRDRLNWYLLSTDAFHAFLHIFSLATFGSLHICRESATRFPFIFLHFCFHLKHLSLNVWPTTLLTPLGMHDSDLFTLNHSPTVHPTALKLTGSNVVDSLRHYVEHTNSGLGNTLSLKYLRALYIAYDEDPACALIGSIWPSKQVGWFLSSFGQPLHELVLEVDHRNYSSRAPCAIPTTTLTQLTHLRTLKTIIHNGPLPELDFMEASEWLLPLLKNLPRPELLESFQLYYSSVFRWTDEFDDRACQGEHFLDDLFQLTSHTFTGLGRIKIQLLLRSMNGLEESVPPPCNLAKRGDYTGLAKLKEKGVQVKVQVVLDAGYDESLV